MSVFRDAMLTDLHNKSPLIMKCRLKHLQANGQFELNGALTVLQGGHVPDLPTANTNSSR